MKRREFVSGVLFTAAAKYSNIIVSLVVSAILARLLTPEDFGIITIATVILTFFAIISDLGIATAIVQNKELTKSDLDHIFSFTSYLGLFVSLIFFIFSPQITRYYEVDSLLNVCKFLSVNLLFSSLNIVPNALLLKAKRFKFIAVRTVVIHAVFGVVSVVSALNGFGMYALLITPIGSSIAIFVVNYIQTPLTFNPKIERCSIAKISAYSTYQFLFTIINYFSRNLDNLLIGRYIGVVDLGYYDKSYRLMMLPLSNIPHVITPVLHPLLSEHQSDREYIFSAYLKLLKLLAYIGFPLSVFLYFEASDLILLIFGDQWRASIPIFEILSISVAPQILSATFGSIFQSTNETKKLFFIGSVNAVVSVTAIVVAIVAYGDIKHVAMFICAAFYINVFVNVSYLFRSVFTKSVSLLLPKIFNQIVLSIILIPLCYCATQLNLGLIASLLATSSVTLVVSLSFMQFSRDYDIISTFRRLVTRSLKSL